MYVSFPYDWKEMKLHWRIFTLWFCCWIKTILSVSNGDFEYFKPMNTFINECFVRRKCIVSRGKMEHGGKMEHRVFRKKVYHVCFYCYVCLISVTGQCGLIQQDQTYRRSQFLISHRHAILPYSITLMYTFGHVPGLTSLTKKVTTPGELLHRIIYLFYIYSRPFDPAKGDSVVDMSRYIEALYWG